MKKPTNPKVFGILAGAAFVVGGALCYLQYNQLSDQQARVEKLKKDVRTESSLRKDLADAETKLADCKTTLQHLEQGVPEAAYVPTLLKDLEEAGKRHDLTVTGVRPVAPDKKPNPAADAGAAGTADTKAYDELNIDVKATGPYANVIDFVKELNTFPKIVAARAVSLTPVSSTNGKKGDLDIEIDLRAYVFKSKPQTDEVKKDG